MSRYSAIFPNFFDSIKREQSENPLCLSISLINNLRNKGKERTMSYIDRACEHAYNKTIQSVSRPWQRGRGGYGPISTDRPIFPIPIGPSHAAVISHISSPPARQIKRSVRCKSQDFSRLHSRKYHIIFEYCICFGILSSQNLTLLVS